MKSVIEKFLKYVSYDTTSDEDSASYPSTEKQLVLLAELRNELAALGLDAKMDEHGYVTATLAANGTLSGKKICFISHVDTSPAVSGTNVKPQIIRYEGGDVVLNEEKNVVFSAAEYPEISAYVGQQIIFTDGTTLLGADDKAGVAEIMTAVEKLIASGAPHGELRIVFTTDEEVGRGTEGLDVKELACDWGYTVDGGELGVYEYENFNAAAALVRVHGVGIHPGSAKNIMKNAATIAMELHSLLPADQVPEKTEGYEGFIHLTDMSGDVVEAELHYIIRDHDRTLFEEKKACLRAAVEEINRRYGEGTAEADISDTYYNMREMIEPHRHLLDRAEAAYRACGVAPRTEAIRGGTDGAVLTWMGLPCPNLSTGGYNYHGVHEFIPVDSLAVMPDVLLEIIGSFVENV